jgi:hypothetical protein
MSTDAEGTSRPAVTPRPAERYGRRARPMPSRPVLALLAALVVAGGVGLAYLGYRNLGDPPIQGQVLDWKPVAPGLLSVRFAVQRDHPDRAAACVLRARSRNGAEVGRVEVAVPAGAPVGARDVAVTADVPVTGTPVIAEVYSCEYRA